MKKLIFRILAVICLAFCTPALCLAGFDLGPFYDPVQDVTGYARSVTGEKPDLATTGICKITLAKLTNQDRWIADFISPCGVLGFATEQDSNGTALVGGQIMNFLGLRFSAYYDPMTRGKLKDNFYGGNIT